MTYDTVKRIHEITKEWFKSGDYCKEFEHNWKEHRYDDGDGHYDVKKTCSYCKEETWA